MTESKPAVKPYQSFCRKKTQENSDVYIVGLDQIAEVQRIKKDCDILVVDRRQASDPNMRILESYKITVSADQKAIIRILLDYNSDHPADPAWKRTTNSLITEWALHNIAYLLGFKPEHTADVDFNNGDEGKGLLDFIKCHKNL